MEVIIQRRDLRQPVSETLPAIEGLRLMQRGQTLEVSAPGCRGHQSTGVIDLGMSGSSRVTSPADDALQDLL